MAIYKVILKKFIQFLPYFNSRIGETKKSVPA